MRIRFLDVLNWVRMGPDIVEGYLIHPDKPWCLSFATSEIEFTRKVASLRFICRFLEKEKL